MAHGMGSGTERGWAREWVLALALLGTTGCSLDKLLNADQLPTNVTDPAVTKTPEGARAVYNGVLVLFRRAFGGGATDGGVSVVNSVGLFTDELIVPGGGVADLRVNPEGSDAGGSAAAAEPYASLQKIRGQAEQAIGLLTDFAPGTQGLIAHAYALAGYAEVALAEFYCSGIPLSTLDYNGDFTLQPGSTTAQVLTHAAALFDTTLTLAGDSMPSVRSMAAVGKARALLALGQYAAAAAAVANVPDAYRYDVHYGNAVTYGNDGGTNGNGPVNFGFSDQYSVADLEGENGLNYISGHDPRIGVTFHPPVTQTNGFITPSRYSADQLGDGTGPIVLASGVEARLIQAEAALQAGDPNWLTILNALRTDGIFDTTETSPPDTLWHAGSGGVAGLAPLAEPDPSAMPGATPARVDLLFRERAFWLFLTGHRQGDLRRLIRQYGRQEFDVYPTGGYFKPPYSYGTDVTLPIPSAEKLSNPLFTGCLSRGA